MGWHLPETPSLRTLGYERAQLLNLVAMVERLTALVLLGPRTLFVRLLPDCCSEGDGGLDTLRVA